MIQIRRAGTAEFAAVREFYYAVIDEMKAAEFKPGWEQDVYPLQDFLRASLDRGELYVGEIGGHLVAAMVVNHEYNESYDGAPWSVDAADEELLVVHALGVRPSFSGQGIAQAMDAARYLAGTGMKTIRLDVLKGNVPAERAYRKDGFASCRTACMFYEDTGMDRIRSV